MSLALADRVRRPPAARARQDSSSQQPDTIAAAWVGPLCAGDGERQRAEAEAGRAAVLVAAAPQRAERRRRGGLGVGPTAQPRQRWSRSSWQPRAGVSVAQQVAEDRGRIAARRRSSAACRASGAATVRAVTPRRKVAPAALVPQPAARVLVARSRRGAAGCRMR